MAIVRQRSYQPDDIEFICRTSEFRPTYFGKSATDHTYRRHIAIDKAAMAERGDELVENWTRRGPPLVAITAFITNDDAFRAGKAALNGHNGQLTLGELDRQPTGTRAEITDFQTVPIRIRYLTSDNQVKTMPCQWFMIILDRNEIEPYGLQLQTLFPLISDKAAARALVKSRSGKLLKTFN